VTFPTIHLEETIKGREEMGVAHKELPLLQ
jgi:hypothetical protein